MAAVRGESHLSAVPITRLPPLSNLIARRLCSLDYRYARLFSRLATGGDVSIDSTNVTPVRGRRISVEIEKEDTKRKNSASDFVNRVVSYLNEAQCLLPLPIGECLVAGVRKTLPLLSSGCGGGGGGGGGFCSSSSGALPSSMAYNPPLPMGVSSTGKWT